MGFSIHTIQVDNSLEFVNDDDHTNRESRFELAEREKGWVLRRTRPYSPCQNGRVERNHREDGKILYNRHIFTRKKDLMS